MIAIINAVNGVPRKVIFKVQLAILKTRVFHNAVKLVPLAKSKISFVKTISCLKRFNLFYHSSLKYEIRKPLEIY